MVGKFKGNMCYNFVGTEKHGQFYARLPDNAKISSLEMDKYLLKEKRFPCELELVPFKDKDKDIPAVWHDYMYNQFAYFIVSERLKAFLEERTTHNDSVEWISVKVRHNETVKNYYITMFSELPDVLDEKNTTYYLGGKGILVPCIAFEKAEKHSVFPLRMANGGFPSLLYTTCKIKQELQKAGFSNLIFEKAKTSFEGIVIK